MGAALIPLLIGTTAVQTRETVRAKDKQKKAIAGTEKRQKEALDKAAADQALQSAEAAEAPGEQASVRRRRIGLRSLRVDPGISFGAGGVGGGVGSGLSI